MYGTEDWTKVVDSTARRRVQNRIAQRNRRKNLKLHQEDDQPQPRQNEAGKPGGKKIVWVQPNAITAGEGNQDPDDEDESEPSSVPKVSTPVTATSQIPLSPPLQEQDSFSSSWPLLLNDHPATFPNFTIQDFATHGQWDRSLMRPHRSKKHETDITLDNFALPSPTPSRTIVSPEIMDHHFLSTISSDYNSLSSNESDMVWCSGQISPKEEANFISHQNINSIGSKKSGSIDDRREIVSKKLAFSETGNSKGYNALHLASQQGKLSIIKLLLETALDIDAMTSGGRSALHLAIEASNTTVIQLLIEQGANCQIRTKEGQTVLHLAAQTGNADTVKILIGFVGWGGAEIQDQNGQTALHVAVSEGHEEVVKLLLGLGVNPHIKIGESQVAQSIL